MLKNNAAQAAQANAKLNKNNAAKAEQSHAAKAKH